MRAGLTAPRAPGRVRRRGGVCAGRDSKWDRCRTFSDLPARSSLDSTRPHLTTEHALQGPVSGRACLRMLGTPFVAPVIHKPASAASPLELRGLCLRPRDPEIELRETLRVEKSVDLDDLPVGDREGHHREDATAWRDDGAGGAVDDRGLDERVQL
jgi:hypothetical protein